MFTPEQYRATAAQYETLLKTPLEDVLAQVLDDHKDDTQKQQRPNDG